MFIKEVKTSNKKSGNKYIKHVLMESVRTEKGPRHRTVMHLGKLELGKKYWPLLSSELEERLSGQISLKFSSSKTSREIKAAADKAISGFTVPKESRKEIKKLPPEEAITVKPEGISSTKYRSFGGEYVCHSIWNELGLPEGLEELGFTAKERSLAEAVVVGRLINPGSELSTWEWIRNISSMGELTEESLETVGLNPFYHIGDKLALNKEEIENHLFKREKKLYPRRSMLYLFDLTNFYFEGQALGNSIAKRGKSKEKRNDCPLVSLGLIVDSDGFPVASRIFTGNISEPKSLRGILEEMELMEDVLAFDRPTLVMDRGIATAENINFLKEYQFPYILITRGPRNAAYLEEFEEHETDPEFITFERNDRKIKVKKVAGINPGTVEILCVSEGRKEKEKAIGCLWTERASEALANLQRSVSKGSMKSIEKINRKLGRLEERYTGLKKHFMINIVEDKSKQGYAIDIIFTQIPVFDVDINDDDPLLGTYVIESTFTEKSAEEIWLLYLTLTRVEAAFRSMKTDLGTRPIYHQIARRTEGHLFISILAYHLLINIEHRLSKSNDKRQWKTIRKVLSTHQRSTIIITDVKNQIHHLRISGYPEPSHQEIYDNLNINPPRYARKYFIAKRL